MDHLAKWVIPFRFVLSGLVQNTSVNPWPPTQFTEQRERLRGSGITCELTGLTLKVLLNPEHTDLSAATEHVPCSWTLFVVGMPSFLRRKHYQKEIFSHPLNLSVCLIRGLAYPEYPGYPEAAGPGRCRWMWQIFNTGLCHLPFRAPGAQEEKDWAEDIYCLITAARTSDL